MSSEYFKNNFANWTSGNKKIDDFIQERQLKIKYGYNIPLEWIPYNQFNEIKETGKNDILTVYSAIWKDGPLYYMYSNNGYTRNSSKKVTLKYLHYSQESIDSLINEANKYSTNHGAFQVLYGISQNPNTGDYILVQNNSINLANWISGNEKIDDFIQERQLKINNYDIILEWIPYNKFNEIKETGKNGLVTVYSAKWKDGPLYKDWPDENYTRDSTKEVVLKCLHNSKESIDSLINEANKYSTNHGAFQVLYGISQNPNTGDYILVHNNSINLANWISGNEKIDDFIQERQLKISNYNIIFEWIPYNKFNEIKETSKNGLVTVYSAIWLDGPIHYHYGEYKRNSNINVALKCLYNSQESIDFLINEANKYSTNHRAFQVLYGISQNPNTGDYILVQNHSINLTNWISGNEKIDDFIQERQLKISNYDTIFEWIPYNKFNEIKETGKNGLVTVYLAKWKDGPLYKDWRDENYKRSSNKEVDLIYLYNSKVSVNSLINEVKRYSINKDVFQVLYGISQNPDTGNYILVQNSCINLANQFSGNERIDDLIQEMQLLKISNHGDIVFEWIPYNQFNNIKEVGKGGFSIVYCANWKNGPLEYNRNENIFKRNPNVVIALKCLYNSQNISNEFLNEVKKYSINKMSNILNIYGISQNPDTKEYIMVLQYAKEGNFNYWMNQNYEHFNWKNKLSALLNIINALDEIHQKNMGLCGEVGNMDETKIYGVMPYVAPEVLRRQPYTHSSDIYSFGMIMYFVATRRQPFDNCAHDYKLALDICKGVRPEINEPEAPRCYIDLMKRCWDLNPNNRPNIPEINELITSFYKLYRGNSITVENKEIVMQFKKAEEYRNANLPFTKNYQITTHPQAVYTSRLLNPFTEDLPEYDDNSQCLDQVI